jgi:hypothetical protein
MILGHTPLQLFQPTMHMVCIQQLSGVSKRRLYATQRPRRCDVRVDIEKSREISAAVPACTCARQRTGHRGVGSESVVHTDIILIPTLYRAVRVC